MMFETVPPFAASEYRIKFAASRWEREEAYALRRAVFCKEQGIFPADDRDAIDDYAIPIVALSMLGVAADRLVGTVRIHEEAPGVWWGSRLAVARDCRRISTLGATLIRLAVCAAHAMGCTTFLAHVQEQNEFLFRRLNWISLETVEFHGRPHIKMQADLAHYPACHSPEFGFVALPRKAA